MKKILKMMLLSTTIIGGITSSAIASSLAVHQQAFELQFQCPQNIPFADLNIIHEKGKEYNGSFYVPVNKEEFGKNLPKFYNVVTTTVGSNPWLIGQTFFETTDHKIMRRCDYEYHSVASATRSVIVGGTKGYFLSIMADTGHLSNHITISNQSNSRIQVHFFGAIKNGSAEQHTFQMVEVDPKTDQEFYPHTHFKRFLLQIVSPRVLKKMIPEKLNTIIPEEISEDVIDCPIQEAGGKFSVVYTSGLISNRCSIEKIK